jgi:hypothetical protein
MPTYAAKTTVSPERSRMELEQILSRYGATAFGYGYDGNRAVVTFRANGRVVRFTVDVPAIEEFKWTSGAEWEAGARQRTSTQQQAALEQSERQRWRALTLVVKAKLEAVEAGISDFEDEFLSHILLPNGTTVGEHLGPQLDEVYATGVMPSLLPDSAMPPAQLTEG